MTTAQQLSVIYVIRDVIQAVDAVLFPTLNKHINYQPGRPSMILAELVKMANGKDEKAKRFPMVALFYDVTGSRGNDSNAYYATVNLPRISIATQTVLTDPTLTRYDKTFNPILFPIYEEFFRQLARHKNVVGNDPNGFKHNWKECPGSQQFGGNFDEVLDAIEIQNLQLTLKTVNNCKS